jgi:NADH dehydrogenase
VTGANRAEAAPHRVVIAGGGFAGLAAARKLRRVPVEVTLIDRRNFHLFQPLLYQVATGGLSPANIASPLRRVLGGQRNCRVVLGEVTGIDVAGRTILTGEGAIPYDTLIVATGATHNYFGHPEWEERAPGLKTVEDATGIRRSVLEAFETAEREALRGPGNGVRAPGEGARAPAEALPALLTFVVVGAGPTGVEMAGALAEMSRFTLRHEFRAIDPAEARILLLEGGDRVLPTFDPKLSERARRSLEDLGVTVRTGAFVTGIDEDGVVVSVGGADERIPARTIVWAAGVEASPLGEDLARAGATLDRVGRVLVEPDLTVPGHPEVFVLGDLASFRHGEKELPGTAPVALQQGAYAARLIGDRVRGRAGRGPFSYWNRGIMATIGRSRAVADAFGVRFWGLPAWLAWLFVHLFFLIEFENRVLVLVQWAWNYITFGRGARLITGTDAEGGDVDGTPPVGDGGAPRTPEERS